MQLRRLDEVGLIGQLLAPGPQDSARYLLVARLGGGDRAAAGLPRPVRHRHRPRPDSVVVHVGEDLLPACVLVMMRVNVDDRKAIEAPLTGLTMRVGQQVLDRD